MLDDQEILGIRKRFPVFREKIYLNSCSQGALCDGVRGAFREYLESWDAEGSPWDRWIEEYEAARKVFARFIGAQPEEVAIVPSASAGINAIASALSFADRRKVVLSEFEFPTMGHVWLAQQPRGAEVQFLESVDDTMPARQYEVAVDRRTLVVPVTGICFMNGWRSELKKIVSCAHGNGALVLLDDYQDCGTRPVNVKDLDVDIYVSGTLKYLLGPPGVAFMYVRRQVSEQLTPTISGWFAQSNPFAFNVRALDLAPTARRFEAGTPPIPNLYGAKSAVELLASIGMAEISEHIRSLTKHLADRTQELQISRKTPLDSAGPLTVLRCKDAEALVRRLAQRQIVVSHRRDGLRVACHVYNRLADVQGVAEALAENLHLLETRNERR